MSSSRTELSWWQRLTAGGCAALVLALIVISSCPRIHKWLHGDEDLGDQDGCAVVLFAAGVTHAGEAIIVVAVALVWLEESAAEPRKIWLAQTDFELPPGCGPPVSAT